MVMEGGNFVKERILILEDRLMGDLGFTEITEYGLVYVFSFKSV